MQKWLRRIFYSKSILSLAGNASAAILGFASFALLARSLDKTAFGNWIIFITITTLLELLRTGFLQTPLIKFIAGADERTQKEIIGSGWVFAFILTAAMSLLCSLATLILSHFYTDSTFLSLFKWMGLFIIISLPYNFASWNLQSEMKFENILVIRLISLGGFVIFLLGNLHFHLGLNYILYAYIIIHTCTSVFCVFKGWCRLDCIKVARKDTAGKIIGFGKYSMGTMIGANLLRSSDTLIIGSLMGAQFVAAYNVATKVFELIEIPLRSVAAIALPNLARYVNQQDHTGLRSFFEKSSGMVTFLLLPIIAGCFVFAEPLVVFLGGAEYADSAVILRIFALFAILLPIDRYCGITLDVLNKPLLNFQKVILMLIVNVAGDLIVIHLFGQLWTIAVVSVFTFSTGVIFGGFFLKKIHNFSVRSVIISGFAESKTYAMKMFSKI